MLELEIKFAESERMKNSLLEEITWYRSQIRTNKEAGMKEVRATFGPGACTSDEIVAGLRAEADRVNALAEEKASRKRDKEKRDAAQLVEGTYEHKAPRGWNMSQLRAQCERHEIPTKSGDKNLSKGALLAGYLVRFPWQSRKRPRESTGPAADDSGDETEDDNTHGPVGNVTET